MGYIGTKPSAVPLTSADIADSIITSAKIVDATIANADIANSTINLTTKVTGTLPVANGGTGLAALGTSLQVLRTNTGATALEYATLSTGAAAGQVIQVLSATDSTQRTTTSATFVTASNTLSVTITPSAAANKVIIITTFTAYADAGEQATYTIFRGATGLGNGNSGMAFHASGGNYEGSSMSFLDSPNTTSAITYQVYFRRPSASQSAYLNANNAQGSIICMEVKG